MAVLKLAFAADIHYYSSSLGDSGRAYELRSGSDQKCLAETGAVTDALLNKLKTERVDAVMIAGDLTNDGEAVCHRELHKKLTEFSKNIPLYVITSTHDWCSDGNARRFEGDRAYKDVETLSKAELNEMYASFGSNNLIASYKTDIGFESRVFQLSEDVRLIAVNDDCDGKNGKSGYSKAHMEWMKKQISLAKQQGCSVIAMEHHLLLHNISPLINAGQSIADNYEAAAELADAGLRLMFTGHSHMQRTTEYVSPSGNKITQVNLGSISGYPAPVTYVDIEKGVATAKVELLSGFDYKNKFYTAKFFKNHTRNVLYNLLISASEDKKDFFERLDADGIKPKGIEKVYPIIKCASKKLLKMKVGTAAKNINALSFGRGISKSSYMPIKNELLLEKILDTFLNAFDGSLTAKSVSTAEKNTVIEASLLPYRAIRLLPIKKSKKAKLFNVAGQIKDIASELMYPSAPDNHNFEVEL